MNTDRLWFCHGALMLNHFVKGYDIEGMLRHNLFIAEKAIPVILQNKVKPVSLQMVQAGMVNINVVGHSTVLVVIMRA